MIEQPKTDEQKVKHCKDMLAHLKQEREYVEPMVDDIIRFVHHSRRKITETKKGNKTGGDVYDGTALSAANLAADGIYGYLCSQSIHWFDFTLPGKLNFPRTSGARAWDGKRLDEYPDVKRWIDDCEQVQYAAFARSNFYDVAPGYVRDGITIGTPTTLIEEDVSRGTIIFTMPHFRECYIAEDAFGRVDTLYRVYKVTMRQLVQKFGMDFLKMRHDFEEKYNKNPYQELEILHATYPRSDYSEDAINSKTRQFASMWILMEGDNKLSLIKEDGYYDLPTVTWRWYKNSDEIYARTPAWDAFITIKTANQVAKTNLIAAHKMVEPPMAAPEDLRGKIFGEPKGVTYISGNVTRDRMPMPLVTGIQLPYGLEQQERIDKAIREHFHVDFFLMLYQAAFEKVDLTATQVVGMQGEQAAILGTRIGRFQSEALNPIMDRVFNIESRAGRMPEPPQILMDMGGAPIEVDYMGPMAQAQKRSFEVQGIRAGMEFIALMSQVFPEARDVVNVDKAAVRGLDSMGFPVGAQNTPDEIRAIREQRQKDLAMQQMIEQAETASKATQKLSKPIEEGSPMEMLMGGGGEGA